MPARRPPPVVHRRREHGAHWAAVFGLLVGALTIGTGGFYLVRQGPGGVGACPPTLLRIVAAPDIAPLLRTAARHTGGRCPQVAVAAQEPADTVRDLRVHPPDVWVPSSTAWLRLAGPDGYPSAGTSLARSPLVVAAPRPVAGEFGWPARQPSWTELADRTYTGQIPRFSVPDPLRTTAGLLAVLGVDIAVGRGGDPGAARMRALTFRSRLADADADTSRLLRQVTAVPDPARDVGLFPVTEQALWSNLRATGARTLVALYPPDGLIEADYPLVMSARVRSDAARRPVVERLTGWFRGAAGIRALTDRGFRPPAGAGSAAAPEADGLLPRYGLVTPVPADTATVTAAVTAWAGYQRMRFQVLLLVDASASMGEPVRDSTGALTTRAALLRGCAAEAVRLLGPDTSAALWLFPPVRGDGRAFVEAVPFGPLDEAVGGVPRRGLLARAFADYQPSSRAGAALYETLLQGQAAMRPRYRPDAATIVFVLTDSADAGAGGRASFLARLAAGHDPSHPVPVYAVGYGPAADLVALREAARVTGGQFVPATNPRDLDRAVATLFLAAHRPS
ncbi:hypothetical protein ACNTMW_21640 [Planosporangium sp. 12N6]|uniref:vWA domain-containing protein n=1 Tax=Planosporangium spinosum TaxID=3402278 RepID=UPI003CE91395